ncbi:DUF1365 domain-containing protein [Proteobacteria bacterium 005FR1]|nr:DUF1365 domain-containing protein [Proteobacteria bacterium 005FR1]
MKSAIYRGTVVHQRITPKTHRFQYAVSMLYLDLAEVDALLERSWGWSARRPAFGWFRRRDFFGATTVTLDEAVRQRIEEQTGERFTGNIRMLTNLRYFGYIINPLVCYYCFDQDESLRFVVAEVTNTPWGEKHSYVLRCDPSKSVQRISFQKEMHVSPFNDMNIEYHWRSTQPGEELRIDLINVSKREKQFAAGLHLQREELGRFSLEKLLITHPLMTVKVAAGIYWQALRLYLKGVPFVPHPGSDSKADLPRDEQNPENQTYQEIK